MRVSRGWVVRALLPAALFALVGCGNQGGGGEGGGGGADAGKPILVGHYAALTGDIATFGQDTDRGVKLAEAELNARGGIDGRRFQVITQDDRSDPQEAVTVVTGFANNPDIVAVLGEVASTISKNAAPVLDNAGIPMITPSSTNEDVTKIGPHIFRVCFIDPFQGYVMARFAHEDLKASRVAILRDQKNDYSVGLANAFTRSFREMGGTIVKDVSYKQGDTDFRAQLAQVKAANPQALYVPGYYNQVGTIARQARELGITAPLMGGDGWDSESLVKGAGGPGKALEGCFFSNHFSMDDKSPRVQEFVQAYKAKYNATPSALAALGYDAMIILADAIRRAGSTDREAVTKAIAETKDFPAVTGAITIDENRNARKSAVVLEIRGNDFAYRQTVPPPGVEAAGQAAAR